MALTLFFTLAFIGFQVEARNLRISHPIATFGSTPYIVGGKDVSISNYPHQVSLQVGRGSHICGGSIISANKIVSAAHCTQGSASGYRIRTGSTSRSRGGQVHQVIRVVNHPFYCGSCAGFPNDISVLTLRDGVVYGTNVQAIGLASGKDFAGETCTITGWGRTGSSNFLPTNLQGVDIGIISNQECISALSSLGGAKINDGHICIYDSEKRTGSCNGDSGGPLKCGSSLAGVTSWGVSSYSSCLQSYPSVYTRVSHFKSWLESQ
ncbi:hypothetical protein CAPTEDRAFT_153991 [Capitella teleta]|uniref:Peptidase S1 domain-containing protein n=1 Tax=Capitella teleta TaxID=283909 RepID=R7U8M6_CAPTE|nr:hypothetical protein CAPTEDRAFT_153991 [Capitella teleta]|eukprot:ELT99465.1 hypothetical protein CAPTEDRAFT_153991 [Capitella teleta]